MALAVSSGSPVLLQGVVGSGKTSLVEHLARLTGRSGPPALMKIQMGDQMDSKVIWVNINLIYVSDHRQKMFQSNRCHRGLAKKQSRNGYIGADLYLKDELFNYTKEKDKEVQIQYNVQTMADLVFLTTHLLYF